MNWLENKLDSFITTIARYGKLECYDCGEFYPKGQPCRCSCTKYPQTSNITQMSKEKFDEHALYQFALDVNKFGPEVAAEMLIRSMKEWAKVSGHSPENTQ